MATDMPMNEVKIFYSKYNFNLFVEFFYWWWVYNSRSVIIYWGNQNILIINFAGDIDLANNIYNYFISNSIIKEKIEIKIEEDNIILSLYNEQDKKVIKQTD